MYQGAPGIANVFGIFCRVETKGALPRGLQREWAGGGRIPAWQGGGIVEREREVSTGYCGVSVTRRVPFWP